VRPQVLADARLRKAYDYALEHPDEHMYNSMRYYNAAAVKYWQTDARAVVLSIIAVVSGIQYANQYWVYESVRPRPPALPRAIASASLVTEPCLMHTSNNGTASCMLVSDKRLTSASTPSRCTKGAHARCPLASCSASQLARAASASAARGCMTCPRFEPGWCGRR
jgi:hypothetical protein